MCCFSVEVEAVGDTRIFAGTHRGARERQVLAYEMSYVAQTDLAMVLPIPVPARSAEDVVEFISLEAYPDFFDDIDSGFLEYLGGDDIDLGSSGTDEPRRPLVVHDVGDFEASFVPAPVDFARLEPRFRMPSGAWDRLPGYADYGFAVFKLKAAANGRRVHPMALSFPRRDPGTLFFPTMHIHDGTVHEVADFDHSIYFQPDPAEKEIVQSLLDSPRRSSIEHRVTGENARSFLDMTRLGEDLVAPALPFMRIGLRGRFENRDITLGTGGAIPRAAS